VVTKENQLIDILEDINTITDALTALDEGASDERRSAIWALQALVERKEAQVLSFEAQINEDGYSCNQMVA
jgi:hypothetical protein|tara:strand:+ start:1126 stop:1338 length:213 start_codon:yes stop_codon:yes gene_type:complete